MTYHRIREREYRLNGVGLTIFTEGGSTHDLYLTHLRLGVDVLVNDLIDFIVSSTLLYNLIGHNIIIYLC